MSGLLVETKTKERESEREIGKKRTAAVERGPEERALGWERGPTGRLKQPRIEGAVTTVKDVRIR